MLTALEIIGGIYVLGAVVSCGWLAWSNRGQSESVIPATAGVFWPLWVLWKILP